MANKTKQRTEVIDNALDYIANTLNDRLAELGYSRRAFGNLNDFNPMSLRTVLNAKTTYSIHNLITYLDAAGLELKIVPKQSEEQQ